MIPMKILYKKEAVILDGKKRFQEKCYLRGIDCQSAFQVGAQKAKRADRFVYNCNPHTRKATQIFAICYFEEEDIYIAWNLWDAKARLRSGFSVKKEDVCIIDEKRVLSVKKYRDHVGKDEELVYAFSPLAIDDFLERICGNLL